MCFKAGIHLVVQLYGKRGEKETWGDRREREEEREEEKLLMDRY